MAKVAWKHLLNNAWGTIDSASVSGIKQPSNPWVFGRNQHSNTLYSPRYNRQKPKGKQVEVRKRYCKCARQYVNTTKAQKAYLRTQAWNYSKDHGISPPLSSYNYFMKACLHELVPLEEISRVHIEGWFLGWTGGYTFDLSSYKGGLLVLRCEGAYNTGYGNVGQGTWCGQYDGHEEGLIYAYCNSSIKEDGYNLGPYINIDGKVSRIGEYSFGYKEFYIPEAIELLQIGVLTSQYVFIHHDLTYTLFEVAI